MITNLGKTIKVTFHLSLMLFLLIAWSNAFGQLEISINQIDANNFPFIFLTTEVSESGNPVPDLTTANFSATEDGRPQTDYFDVTPPETGGGVRLVDFVFLIDNSGSMGPEIQAVKNNVNAFADLMAASGIDLRLGAVRFGQSAGGGMPFIFNNGNLTEDLGVFHSWINQMYASGSYEPGLLAIYQAATTFNFRPGSQRHFLLITDEDSDQGSLSQTVSTCLANNIVAHVAVDCGAGGSYEDYCRPGTSISGATGGLVFPVVGPYDEILDELGEVIANTYIVRYRTDNPNFDGLERTVVIEINAFSQTDTDVGYYTPGAGPQITRTQETIDLSSNPPVEGDPITIAADIVDNVPPGVVSAAVYYRTVGESGYSSVNMIHISGTLYNAEIPGGGVVHPGVQYYITATDGQLTSSDPSMEPGLNPYNIAVLPNYAPVITHTPIEMGEIGDDILVYAEVVDNTYDIATVTLYYRKTGTIIYDPITMANSSGDTYYGIIPGSDMTDDGIDYYIYAEDDLGVSSTHGPHSIIAPWYFLHLTDTHYGYYGAKENVRSLIDSIGSWDQKPKFLIVSGDILSWGFVSGLLPIEACLLADCIGNDYAVLKGDFNELNEDYGIRTYVSPGNHDYYTYPYAPISLLTYLIHFGVSNYYAEYNNLRLVSLDSGYDDFLSQPWFPPKGTGLSSSQINNLDDYLDGLDGNPNNESDDSNLRKVVMMHHPVINYHESATCWRLWPLPPWYSCDRWDAGVIHNNRNEMIDVCEQYDVDVVCCGHLHGDRVYNESMDWSDQDGYSLSQHPVSTLNNTLYLHSGPASHGHYRKFWVYPDNILVFNDKQIQNCIKVWKVPFAWEGKSSAIDIAALNLYDSFGNHVGRNELGELDFEIEGAGYHIIPLAETEELDPALWQIHEEELSLLFNGQDNYTYEIVSQHQGSIFLYIEKDIKEGGRINLFFDNLTVSENSIGKLYLTGTSLDYNIYMDDDGDGIVDREIQPTSTSSTDAPYRPLKPSGRSVISINNPFEYRASTDDPENDGVLYNFDWGEGTNSGWLGPFSSGDTCTESNTWMDVGSYEIRVRAKDVSDNLSDWSNVLTVAVGLETGCIFMPELWSASWADDSAGTIRVIFHNFPDGYANTDLTAESILLNGEVPLINGELPMRPSWPGVDGPVAVGAFDRRQAVLSLSDTFEPGDYTCVVHGDFGDGIMFVGESDIILEP